MSSTMMEKDKHQKHKSYTIIISENPLTGWQGMEELLLAKLVLTLIGMLGMAHL